LTPASCAAAFSRLFDSASCKRNRSRSSRSLSACDRFRGGAKVVSFLLTCCQARDFCPLYRFGKSLPSLIAEQRHEFSCAPILLAVGVELADGLERCSGVVGGLCHVCRCLSRAGDATKMRRKDRKYRQSPEKRKRPVEIARCSTRWVAAIWDQPKRPVMKFSVRSSCGRENICWVGAYSIRSPVKKKPVYCETRAACCRLCVTMAMV